MATLAATRAAVLVPGGGYTTDGPLLMYARLAVERRGGYAHRIAWTPPRSWNEAHAWVAGQVAAAVGETVAATGVAAAGAGAPLVIGKSLGSLAAPLVADRGLAAVWFTPLLTDQPTVAALHRASAPCLLVGGTADELWDGAVARSVTPHVVEVAGADHGMFVPGGLAGSAAVLGQVITAVERFLDQVVWPAGRAGPDG
jgi:predicted alpha/beta-hydrolase family hydrolase